jgi:EamA domain-containing membrane protein RarD
MFIINFIVGILQWINDTPVAHAIRNSSVLFPAIETLHVVAIVLVVGSITRLDMRLIGLVWRNRPITEVSEEMLPWTWISFVLATVFGLLLWSSKPIKYLEIGFFDVKMILLLCAGLNMLIFQFFTFRNVAQWDRDPIPPTAVRVAGALSMIFWIGVVVCGRFIGFV